MDRQMGPQSRSGAGAAISTPCPPSGAAGARPRASEPDAAEPPAEALLREAFRAIALCEPPADAWPRLAARLNRRGKARRAPAPADAAGPPPDPELSATPPRRPDALEPAGPQSGG